VSDDDEEDHNWQNSHLFQLRNSLSTYWILRMVDNILCSNLQLGSLYHKHQVLYSQYVTVNV